MNRSLIEDAIVYVQTLFRDNAGGHDAGHTMRVYRNVLEIAGNELDCDRETAALAALLHDADDHKLFATENNANARSFMKSRKVSEEQIEKVCRIINSVSFSRNKDRRPDTLEAMAVQDADRLDAMGAVGIARTFAYGGEHGRPMEESVQHFYDKLLQLKDLMNTETGRRIAEKRHAFLEIFLQEYTQETVFRQELDKHSGGIPDDRTLQSLK